MRALAASARARRARQNKSTSPPQLFKLNPGGLELVKSSALDSYYFVVWCCVFVSLLFTAHLINCIQLIN
jgi:hypothetical protein